MSGRLSGRTGSDPRADLHRYLQAGREALLWRLDGFSEYDTRRPMVPTGTNLLGLVKHVASVEAEYLGDCFSRPFDEPLRSGATLAMGSDWSVTTANPLEEIEVAVTRVDPENLANTPFLPKQALPLQAALAAFTVGSAYVNHDEDGGSLQVGHRADLAMLDRNVLTPGAGSVADAHVDLTVASGRVVDESRSSPG